MLMMGTVKQAEAIFNLLTMYTTILYYVTNVLTERMMDDSLVYSVYLSRGVNKLQLNKYSEPPIENCLGKFSFWV